MDKNNKGKLMPAVEELAALLSLLELVDVEQIDPVHHNQVVRLCSQKVRVITDTLQTLGKLQIGA